jgi:hypothetical protein
MLEAECRDAGVPIFLSTRIQKVERTTDFIVRSEKAEFRAPTLVVATGGLSIPKIGATSYGYDIARQFGLALREPWPALVPLLLNSEERSRYCDLAGVSTNVIVWVNTQDSIQQFREKMLITHRGLSGPAILQISSYWKKSQPILVDLAPACEVTAAFHDPAFGVAKTKTPRTLATVRNELRRFLPHRLADRWLDLHAPASWTNHALAGLEKQVHSWAIAPTGTEGYEKAEVTAGGVDTCELSAKTMESLKVPGLFFIGEIVDVTGHLGGFNFQWAWSSGAAAGRAL